MDKSKIINELVFEALIELCSLKDIKIDENFWKKFDSDPETILAMFNNDIVNKQAKKPISFQDLIKNARQKADDVKNNKDWKINSQKKEELEIIEQARKEGKTEYDPEILRKLILLRQKYKQVSS